jgi:hypothetical protein
LRLSAFCHLLFIWRLVSTVIDPVLHCWINLTKADIAARFSGRRAANLGREQKNAPRERDRLG